MLFQDLILSFSLRMGLALIDLISFRVLTPLLSTALGLSEWRQVFIGVGSQIVRRKPLTVDWNGVHLYHRIRKSQPQTGYSDYSSYY